MIHTKYCEHCGTITTWFKDMCMKCQKKEKPKEKQANNPFEMFESFFGAKVKQ